MNIPPLTDIPVLIYIILGFILAAIGGCAVQLFKVKVWLRSKSKRDPRLVKIGVMDYKGNQEVPEVRLIGRSKGPAIGRIKMGDDDDYAYVELLTTDGNDDSIKPQYRTLGYITQEGVIYKQLSKAKKPEKVGYTAKPSSPTKPSAVGERNWKTMWLRCTLNVYDGHPKEKGKPKQPCAIASYTGIHSSKNDAMPPEARAAAFCYFFGKYNKNDYHEYYNSPAYGWKDTALLAAFFYAIIYIIFYLVYFKVTGHRFVGYQDWMIWPLYLLYYPVWAVVRAIKIECIERSNTIQPKIDLFNKALGQRGFDIAIMICCAVTLAFTGTYYQLDFVPLAMVIITGITTNMLLASSSKRWEIKNPFSTDEEEEDDFAEEVPNPEGDIARSYQWELDSDTQKDVIGELTLYFNAQYITDLRFANPFYCQRKDQSTKIMITEMFHYMKEHRGITARVRYVSSQIRHMASQKGLTIEDTIQFALDFVQEPNIRFVMNRDSKAINQFEEYIRFPDEVLYDKEADSNSKSLLAAMIFHYMRHNVLYLFSRVQHHGALGIEIKAEWIEDGKIFGRNIEDITIQHNGKRYLFCETTADGFRIGGTMDGMRYEDFDEQILLPLVESDVDDTNEDTVTCLYSWDLDSEMGNELHGSYTLEFSRTEIEDLRSKNPFKTYGQSPNTYEDNIKTIFNYLSEDSERSSKIHEIAEYIKQTVKDANLGELDLVQFALDFCQAPNITYCVDDKSAGINYAKEYMRFPDEVLFDKEGDCDCKSSLTAALLHELGYHVIVMISAKLQHAAIGVECKDEGWLQIINPDNPDKVLREYNGIKYLFCETTGDGYKIGHINDEYDIHDFGSVVEIKA